MYKGKKYWIAVNGQTAKVDSLLPPDRVAIIKKLIIPILIVVALLATASFVVGSELNIILSLFTDNLVIAVIIAIIFFVGSMKSIMDSIYKDHIFHDKYHTKKVYELKLENKRCSLFNNYKKREYINIFDQKELTENKKIKIFHDGISSDYTKWEDEIKQ